MKIEKIGILITLAFALCALLVLVSYTQERKNPRNVEVYNPINVLDKKVSSFKIKSPNINRILSKIAYDYNVPIGFEISPFDDSEKEEEFVIEIENGTIRDVFDSLQTKLPHYNWEVVDGVINFFPKEPNRDPVLRSLLLTKFAEVSIAERTSRLEFRQWISKSEELKPLLIANNLKIENEANTIRDIGILNQDVAIYSFNIELKNLLNRILKETSTKYWIVNRYGKNRSYLVINL